MNCKHCDYPLWNLRSRQCPECGVSFRPSEFRFAKNAVRYACPHCGQDYYGTGTNGHLEPRSFPCVGCGDRIDMDEMVLLPTEGITERQTQADINPWLDESRRFRSRWLGTLYRGACMPSWLLRSTPVESGTTKAWGFAVLSFVLIGLVMLSPILLFVLAAILTGGGGVGGVLGSFILFGVVTGLVSVAGLGLWVLITHAILKIGGTTEGGVGRTAQALCYTSAPQLCVFVPCFGIYLGWVGTIWWVVAAGFALAAAQKVSGLRAAIAVAVLPLICGVLVAGGVVWMYASFAKSMASFGTANNAESVSVFRQPLHDAAAGGAWPGHVGALLLDGALRPYDFTAPFSMTLPGECVLETTSLEVWEVLSLEAQQGMVARVIAAMPPETVAHRLGDFVFTYHGIDPADPPDDLWLVIEAWDPTVSGQQWQTQMKVHVLTTQGTVRSFDRAMIGVELQTQNALRASHGLGPLPDPFSVLSPPPPPSPPMSEDPG